MHARTDPYIPEHISYVLICMYMSTCTFMDIWLTILRHFFGQSKLMKMKTLPRRSETLQTCHALLCIPDHIPMSYMCMCVHTWICRHLADHLEEFSWRLKVYSSENISQKIRKSSNQAHPCFVASPYWALKINHLLKGKKLQNSPFNSEFWEMDEKTSSIVTWPSSPWWHHIGMLLNAPGCTLQGEDSCSN